MDTMNSHSRGRIAALALMLGVATPAVLPAPALAQSQPAETTEQKVRRHDGEIKALQRKVFPDGAGKYFAPEIAPNQTATTPPVGTPASGPVSDLLVRMDALEAQNARLTAQLEEAQNRLSKLEAQIAAMSPPPATTPMSSLDPAAAPAPTNGATIATNTAAMTGGASVKPAPAPAVTTSAPKPAPDRVAAVQAIEKPQTNDRGEDEYTYGFRLWEAKFYPEAQQQLLRFVGQYPRHKRISYARNLLGRAYLDDGKPGTAAQYFVQNYNADMAGDRAPDSLLYLAVSMTRLKETKRACVALQELGEKFPGVVAGRLAADYRSARAGVKCN